MKYFDNKRNILLFFIPHLKKDYWDEIWDKYWHKLSKDIYKFDSNSIICQITQRFLHPNEGPILEGGCGLGKFVYSLKCINYDVIGIDNAKLTIEKLKKFKPSLNIKLGDVREIPFPDNYFAGYWSLGVIEHFFEGYSQILSEMRRVLKPNGYLFITFPYMSPLRKFKSRVHLYKYFNLEIYERDKAPRSFYQYVLNEKLLIDELQDLGFELRYIKPRGGIKGFKDEIFFLKFFIRRFLQLLYNNQNSKFLNLFKVILEKILNKFTGNSILLVFQKI